MADTFGGILYGLLEIGAVPSTNSILNSTSLSGGKPNNSSRNTSGNSQTIGISLRVVAWIAEDKFWRSKLWGSGTRKALPPYGSLNIIILVLMSMRIP